MTLEGYVVHYTYAGIASSALFLDKERATAYATQHRGSIKPVFTFPNNPIEVKELP